MPESQLEKRIEECVRQIIDPLGFDLVELRCMRVNHSSVVRILVDRRQGGITLQECSDLNKRIGVILDEKDIMPQHYTLEVSSPGLDRYLCNQNDFKRSLHKELSVFLQEEHEGKRQWQGVLMGVDEQGIIVKTVKEQRELSIPFLKIHKAKQVII